MPKTLSELMLPVAAFGKSIQVIERSVITMKEERMIETEKNITIKSRGGRPKKAVKRTYAVTVKCTILERKVIERKAKEAGLTLSEYLRIKGLDGNFVRQQKVLPKEFLEYKALLHHTAANLNQIARKSNSTGEINRAEKEALLALEEALKQHIVNLQNLLYK